MEILSLQAIKHLIQRSHTPVTMVDDGWAKTVLALDVCDDSSKRQYVHSTYEIKAELITGAKIISPNTEGQTFDRLAKMLHTHLYGEITQRLSMIVHHTKNGDRNTVEKELVRLLTDLSGAEK